MAKLTKGAKIFFSAIIVSVALFGVYKLKSSGVIPGTNEVVSSGSSATPDEIKSGEKPIRVGVNTWPGYIGGQYFNNGFKASKESEFYKQYGILVEFVVIDDFEASRAAFKSGDIDMCWTTADVFGAESKGLESFEPKIFYQIDWSRGGDAIVVRRGINSVADLKSNGGTKKKIAVAPLTPSHTLLISMFNAGEVKMNDVEIVEVANAIDAADLFKKNQVDAAVVWSPDDLDCVSKVSGSKILVSTKTASNIIADCFFAKASFLNDNKDAVSKLIEGFMKGSAAINAGGQARDKAISILMEGYNMDKDLAIGCLNNVRLCTYGDNINGFNIEGNYKGATCEELYTSMSSEYVKYGYIKSYLNWKSVYEPDFVRNVHLTGSENAGESSAKFAPTTSADVTKASISSKNVSISFSSSSTTLDDNAKYIIDKEFVDIAKQFSYAKIRIEGNTDNTGSDAINIPLSKKRAQAVADYLVSQYGFDRNRFVIVGNGSTKPVADNTSTDGKAKNRRTDFELLQN